MNTPFSQQKQSLLLHTCCGPCAGGVIDYLLEEGKKPYVYFYNPNIHPQAEYLKRKQVIKAYCAKRGVEFEDGDYDTDRWFAATAGMEHEPERGKRCTTCFGLRLGRSAQVAHTRGFDTLATTLGISRWKDLAQVNRAGQRAAEPYAGLKFWDMNWRKGGGLERMRSIIQTEAFYVQDYCGCVYSLAARGQNN